MKRDLQKEGKTLVKHRWGSGYKVRIWKKDGGVSKVTVEHEADTKYFTGIDQAFTFITNNLS